MEGLPGGVPNPLPGYFNRRSERCSVPIREYTQRGAADEISEVIGSPYYAQNYVFKELRNQILSPHSTQLVPVSRFYMRLRPQVVVDFEPNPLEGVKFYAEEKRKFFHSKNVVYVPIYIRELLTREQFKARVDDERALLAQAHQESMEDAALADVNDGALDAETIAAIDKETHRRVEELRQTKHLYGIALTRTYAKVKSRVITELLKERKHGRVGTVLSRIESSSLTW